MLPCWRSRIFWQRKEWNLEGDVVRTQVMNRVLNIIKRQSTAVTAKEYGYKFDVVHDLDQETLPLCYTHMEITEDEGKDLIPAQDNLHQLKIEPEEGKINGKYATLREHSEKRAKEYTSHIQNTEWMGIQSQRK